MKQLCQNCLCLPSENRSTLKGKNLGANSFLSEKTHFQKGHECRKANSKSQKLSHLHTRAVVGQRSSPAGYILYCNIFIIKKFKMYNNNETQTHHEFLLRLK